MSKITVGKSANDVPSSIPVRDRYRDSGGRLCCARRENVLDDYDDDNEFSRKRRSG